MSMKSLSLPAGLGWLICGAGAAGIFATYWDESWHTDIGRDSFWTPAHLLLYGAMAVAGRDALDATAVRAAFSCSTVNEDVTQLKR